MSELAPSGGPSSRDRWMGLLAAFLGWMFDGLEMGIFPLIAHPALTSMFKEQGVQPDQINGLIGQWTGNINAYFLIGAASGGFAFGWLGDRIGRVPGAHADGRRLVRPACRCFGRLCVWRSGSERRHHSVGFVTERQRAVPPLDRFRRIDLHRRLL